MSNNSLCMVASGNAVPSISEVYLKDSDEPLHDLENHEFQGVSLHVFRFDYLWGSLYLLWKLSCLFFFF